MDMRCKVLLVDLDSKNITFVFEAKIVCVVSHVCTFIQTTAMDEYQAIMNVFTQNSQGVIT